MMKIERRGNEIVIIGKRLSADDLEKLGEGSNIDLASRINDGEAAVMIPKWLVEEYQKSISQEPDECIGLGAGGDSEK